MKRLISIFALGVLPFLAQASDEGWQQYDSYDGMAMFRREIPGSPLLAYRGEGVLEAPLNKLLTVITDTAAKPRWMSRVKEAETVREISPTEKIEYVHVRTPFILKDRDFLYKTRIEVDRDKKQVTVRYESVEDPVRPVYPDKVRAQIFSGVFTLTSLDGGKRTRVDAEAHADPKGSVPKWIVNIYQKRLPRESLEGLLKQVSQPGIKGHPLVASWF